MQDFNYLSPALNNISPTWRDLLLSQCRNELIGIDAQLTVLHQHHSIYPPSELIFNALTYTQLENINIVILGQDPYHGAGEANGLAFSVNKHVKTPPSLRNIYKELAQEYNVDLINANGELLIQWARQGVLLLNASLSVIKDQPNSLSNIGWNVVTDKLIQYISKNCTNVVFMLWGKFAIQKRSLIDVNKHLVLESTHPSPFSAHKGFLGCGHFIKANQYLHDHNKTMIKWCNE